VYVAIGCEVVLESAKALRYRVTLVKRLHDLVTEEFGHGMGALLERSLGRRTATESAFEGLASQDNLFVSPEPTER
jgi:hypothetical protein